MNIIELTEENFEQEINRDKPILVDFWATWCGPCRMIAPILEEIASENHPFLIGKVNVDLQGNIADKYRIAAIPTLLVFKNGECIKKSVGLVSKQEILELVK